MKFVLTALAVTFLQPAPTATDAQALVNGTRAMVYMTINNPSMYDIYIVSGKSEAAESVTFMDGNKTVTSLTVPAYGSIELRPATTRIALSGLQGQFKEGDELKLTLETDGGVGIPIAAIVKIANP
jgi:copper(I)-binding protein